MSEQRHDGEHGTDEREDGRTGPRGHGDRTPWRIARRAADAMSVRRAFGEPIRQGDVVLVPVARVTGGSGAGYGSSEITGDGAPGRGHGAGSGGGGGAGFGLTVRPVGVYVVDGSSVLWQPALDLTRVVLGGQVVGAVAVLALACALRRRRRHRR
ncbi:MAG TPA: spore germination protein GerW family protein [Actinotalea sp.]|nr:spore germination protein GerW family protein [Actinotalea sp.]